MREKFARAQAYVDQACIRHMDKYTPMMTGALKRSATIGTKIGSGKIEYASPYARYLYYGKVMEGPKYGPKHATDKDLVYTKQHHAQSLTLSMHAKQQLLTPVIIYIQLR